jgi:hypothetical protein
VKPGTKTTGPLGGPQRMRPSSGRGGFGFADPIGAHELADGREAWVCWLLDTQTHCHVVVWIPGDEPPRVVEHVARVNAAVESEKILQELES